MVGSPRPRVQPIRCVGRWLRCLGCRAVCGYHHRRLWMRPASYCYHFFLVNIVRFSQAATWLRGRAMSEAYVDRVGDDWFITKKKLYSVQAWGEKVYLIDV